MTAWQDITGPGAAPPVRGPAGGAPAAELAARRVLYVPDDVVIASWRALRPTADAGTEGVVLWAGPATLYTSTVQVVTTVVVPRQRVGPGRYELPTDAVRAMGRALRGRGLVNVAQLHTHPAGWVGHSAWDDAHAFSMREGALSLVWPWYGRVLPPPERWGVHERQDGRWRALGPGEAAARVRVVPSTLDLRGGIEWLPPEAGDGEADDEGPDHDEANADASAGAPAHHPDRAEDAHG